MSVRLSAFGRALFIILALLMSGSKASAIDEVISLVGTMTEDDGVYTTSVDVPENLRGLVYSGTAVEIFWDRAAAAGTTYEVSRDGSIIRQAFDGLSVFDADLEADRQYHYAVVAIVDGERSVASTLSLTTNSTLPAVTAPLNVRGTVYSSTAVEIFWDRSEAPGILYEVKRNGRILRSAFDGLSVFDEGLEPGETYLYDVVAILDGRRSTANSISLTTYDTAWSLSAPQNLYGVVYSSTALEIFWDRSAVPGITYEVKRNDTVIHSATDGVSVFENGLEPGTDYKYEVRAIADGKYSAPATLYLATRAEQQDLYSNAGEILNSMIGENLINQASLLEEKFNQTIELATLQDVDGPNETVDDPSALVPTVTTITRSTYQCNAGGTMIVTETDSVYSPGSEEFYINIYDDSELYSSQNCRTLLPDDSSLYINGEFEHRNHTSRGSRTYRGSSTSLWTAFEWEETVQGSRQRYVTDARLGQSSYSEYPGFTGSSRTVSITELEQHQNDAAVMRLENVDYSQSESNMGAGSTIKFEISGDHASWMTDNLKVTVTTQTPFHVVGGPPTTSVAASGSFLLQSENRDTLAIDVLPLETVDSYYFADFALTRADGSTEYHTTIPFFRYLAGTSGSYSLNGELSAFSSGD